MATVFRAAALTNYFEVAEHLGLNPQPLLSEHGLSRSQLTDPENRIPAAATIALLEESASQSNCETFGLLMAESRQLADFGAVSLLLTHQPTLRSALQAVVQYEHLLNEGLAISIEEAGKTVIVRDEVVTDPPIASRQATELAVGALFRLCSALLGAHWQPYSVNFTHEAPENLQVHRRVFRCKLNFGSDFNGFTCPIESLDYPNPTADPSLAQIAERYVGSLPAKSEHSITQDTRKMIVLLLPTGRATIDQVAMTLGMNVRTLQRRLEESGPGFSDLVNSVRRELVMRHIENPRHSLGRVAELLGYSVASSFTRWFKSQFGASPAEWRAKHIKRSS